MLTDNQKKWVAALRSGEYEQGQEELQNGSAFCCIGVACKLAAEDGVEVEYWRNEIEGAELCDQGIAVSLWIGLTNIGEGD